MKNARAKLLFFIFKFAKCSSRRQCVSLIYFKETGADRLRFQTKNKEDLFQASLGLVTHVEQKKRDIAKHLYSMLSIFALPLCFLKLFGASFCWSGLACLRCWVCLMYFCTFLFKGVLNQMMCLCLFFSCVSLRGCSGSYFSLSLPMSIPR